MLVINFFRNSKRFRAIIFSGGSNVFFRSTSQFLLFFLAFISFFQISVGYNHYSCKCWHYTFRGGEIFAHNLFFVPAQLVSALKLSALYPLRQFCSVANLKFNYFAWHVCLDWNFNETYENFSISIFFIIFCAANVCFMFVLYRKWCEALLQLFVKFRFFFCSKNSVKLWFAFVCIYQKSDLGKTFIMKN